MSEFKRFTDENQDAINAAGDKALEIAKTHLMCELRDLDGCGYPIVDRLSHPEDETIESGCRELDSLIDAIIVDAIMTYEKIKNGVNCE